MNDACKSYTMMTPTGSVLVHRSRSIIEMNACRDSTARINDIRHLHANDKA